MQYQQDRLGGVLCGPLDESAEIIARQIFPAPEPFLPADALLAGRLFNLTGHLFHDLNLTESVQPSTAPPGGK